MHSNDVPVRMTHLWRRVDDRMVILSDASFNVRRFELNQVGALTWEMCDGTRSAGEIADALVSTFPEEDPQRIRDTVFAFLDDLEREWLVRTRRALAAYA